MEEEEHLNKNTMTFIIRIIIQSAIMYFPIFNFINCNIFIKIDLLFLVHVIYLITKCVLPNFLFRDNFCLSCPFLNENTGYFSRLLLEFKIQLHFIIILIRSFLIDQKIHSFSLRLILPLFLKEFLLIVLRNCVLCFLYR